MDVVRVDHCDDEQRLVFGCLDNEPLGLRLGQELAVSYDLIREPMKASAFKQL
jgi:hypothetical protein